MISELTKAHIRVRRFYGMQKIDKVQHDVALNLIALLDNVIEQPHAAEFIKDKLPIMEKVVATSANGQA